MQRREFARSLILGTGAACTLSLPGLASAFNESRPSVSTVLAKVENYLGQTRWRSIEQCSSNACATAQRVRLAIETLAFPSTFGSLAIDAMFSTQQGIRPFRVAMFQPGSVSPTSKPFSFEVADAGLAGFRIEHTTPENGRTTIAASALLGAAHPTLTEGRYLLALAGAGTSMNLEVIDVPEQGDQPLRLRSGALPTFAHLTFSVHPLTA